MYSHNNTTAYACVPTGAPCMKKATAHSDFPWLFFFLFAVLYILEKESEDFASCVFPSGLFVVHDASWGGQHNVSVETRVSMLANDAALSWLNVPGYNEDT